MKYDSIVEGVFVSRPNRFIANVEINGELHTVHVKNTGRCRELLLPGAKVYLEASDNPARKTKYDLVTVIKNGNLINMDSMAPNRIFHEWARSSGFFGKNIKITPEYKYKNSRFDFYIRAEDRKILVEVKGVTLEQEGVLMFPDAPTERGVKHLRELIDARENGFESFVFFIAQMKDCKYLVPNRTTHPEFAETLSEAFNKGVKVNCLNCNVSVGEVTADGFVNVIL